MPDRSEELSPPLPLEPFLIDIPASRADAIHVTELLHHLGPRLLLVHSTGQELINPLVDMKAQLGVYVLIDAAAAALEAE